MRCSLPGRALIRALRRPLERLVLTSLLLLLAPHITLAQEAPPGSLQIAVSGQKVELYRNSYALVIGASQYRSGWAPLGGVRSDVVAVRQALEAHGFQVEVLEDPDAETLPKRLSQFAHRRGQDPTSRLVIYYAGHGHVLPMQYGGEMGYLVPVDAPLPARDEAGFRRVALDMEQVVAVARRIQSRHALFVLDACFSGAIFSIDRAPPPDVSFKLARPVRQFITSGTESEKVPDQSIFRQQFVAGLAGDADLSGDGYVTGTELGEFLSQSVTRYSRGAQHPLYGKIRDPNLDRGDTVFEVGQRQAEPVALAQGTAWLNAIPQASIAIDGQRQAAFPVQNLPLPAGDHVVRFEWGAGQRLEQRIAMRGGTGVRCTARLDRGTVTCIEDGTARGATTPPPERRPRVVAPVVTGGGGRVLILPGIREQLVPRSIAAAGPPVMLASPGQIVKMEADTGVLDDLRRRWLVHSFQPGDSAKAPICDPTLPAFRTALEQAGEALDYLELERAGALLSQGWSAFACEEVPVRRADLARYLFLSGLLQIYLQQDDAGLFAEALALAPDMPAPDELSREVRERFAQAKQGSSAGPVVGVRLRSGDLAGLELWVDGLRFEGDQTLVPGHHFLQLRGADGMVLGGSVALLTAEDVARGVDWPPARLRAPEREAVLAELLELAASGPSLRASLALEELMRVADWRWLLLLAPAEAASVQARLIEPGGQHSSYRVRSRAVPKTGVAATITSSAVALISAGLYAWHRSQLYPVGTPDVSNEALRRNAAGSLGGVALGIGGAAVSISLTWQLPPRLYRNRAPRRETP